MPDKNTVVKQALVLCLQDPAADPRPHRIVEWLASRGFEVDIVSESLGPGLHHRKHYALPNPASSRRARFLRKVMTFSGMIAGILFPFNAVRRRAYEARFTPTNWRRANKLGRYDLIVVENPLLLPYAFRIKGTARVVFDAREYYSRQIEDSLRFRLFKRTEAQWLCSEYLPRCDAVFTVSDSLAEAYEQEFGIRPQLLRSVPRYLDLPVRKTDSGCIRIVHHGIANRNRQIEKLIEIGSLLDSRFHTDLYLTGAQEYITELRARISGDSRVRILAPIPLRNICATLNRYDIGLFYVEPLTFNLKHCLPNKLFEFIQARLAVAIGPSPDMAEVVREHRCGIVAPWFTVQSMVETLNAINAADIDELKRSSDMAAKALNFEVEVARAANALVPVSTA